MSRLPRWHALASTVVFFGCTAAATPRMTDAERTAISDSIRAISGVFAQGVNALDVSKFAPYFANPQLTWAGDGQLMLMSPDSLMSLYRGVYRGFRRMDFAWDTLRVSVLNADAALLVGAGHYAVTDTSGQASSHGVAASYLFVRLDGQWRLAHGHASHRVLAQ
jgi:uncharacterized protein (TIGR02246 family)